MYGKKHSNKTKSIMSDAKKGRKLSNKTKQKISDTMPNSIKIEVNDITNNYTTSYDSIREAARALNINNAIIVKYFSNNQQKPYKNRYTFKKL